MQFFGLLDFTEFAMQTESLSYVKVNSNEASNEVNNCDENEGGLVKPKFIIEEMEVGDRDIEEAELLRLKLQKQWQN